VTTKGYGDRIGKLYELVSRLNSNALSDATNHLIRRVSYVDFFGVALDVVPRYVPFQDGAIWWDAVSRPFMPRLFFPHKEIIDDTKRTNEFTRGLAGPSGGSSVETSVSLGYIAESYIDFGPYLMMAPPFLFGILCGQIFRRFLEWKASRGLLGMGLSVAVLLPITFLEISITKAVAALAVSALVAWAFVFMASERFFPWVRART
jgi:hypothetical protein